MFQSVKKAHPKRRHPIVCVSCQKSVDFNSPHWRFESPLRIEMCDTCHSTLAPRPDWFWDLVNSILAMRELVFHGGSTWGIRGRQVDGITVFADTLVLPADFADRVSERATAFNLAVEYLQRPARPEERGLLVGHTVKGKYGIASQDPVRIIETFDLPVELLTELICDSLERSGPLSVFGEKTD